MKHARPVVCTDTPDVPGSSLMRTRWRPTQSHAHNSGSHKNNVRPTSDIQWLHKTIRLGMAVKQSTLTFSMSTSDANIAFAA